MVERFGTEIGTGHSLASHLTCKLCVICAYISIVSWEDREKSYVGHKHYTRFLHHLGLFATQESQLYCSYGICLAEQHAVLVSVLVSDANVLKTYTTFPRLAVASSEAPALVVISVIAGGIVVVAIYRAIPMIRRRLHNSRLVVVENNISHAL